MRSHHLLAVALLLLASCEQARRYPPAPPSDSPSPQPKAEKKRQPLADIYSWIPPVETPRDVPIEFVAVEYADWAKLPKFWNQAIPPEGGMRTIHLGQQPLEAVAAMVVADQLEMIRIKVPLGLPDPKPFIPSANPPTYGKWRLGQAIFFTSLLQGRLRKYSCASCHDTTRGFADPRERIPAGEFKAPSLVNALYNRHQFWDGRAGALEEVVVRSLEDERPRDEAPDRLPPEVTHVWGGLVQTLAKIDTFRFEFDRVFGIAQPTQDAIGKALATYMRTILSGDSLYDRAEKQRKAAKADALTAAHFLPALDDPTLTALVEGKLSKDETAAQIVRGHQLFVGKARCAECHRGPLFTDDDFHNIGIPSAQNPPGRLAAAPIGLKDVRLTGAFKTPSLRGLSRRAPYFHDGSRATLESAVRFFDSEILMSPYLASSLRSGDQALKLGLTDVEVTSLTLFLRALDGRPVEDIVARPMK